MKKKKEQQKLYVIAWRYKNDDKIHQGITKFTGELADIAIRSLNIKYRNDIEHWKIES